MAVGGGGPSRQVCVATVEHFLAISLEASAPPPPLQPPAASPSCRCAGEAAGAPGGAPAQRGAKLSPKVAVMRRLLSAGGVEDKLSGLPTPLAEELAAEPGNTKLEPPALLPHDDGEP